MELVIDAKGQPVPGRDGKHQWKPTDRHVVHIVAPNYDGSQRSLEATLGGWPKRDGRSYHFRVLSNHAGRIDQAHLQRSVTGNGHVLTFRSMVHESSTVLHQMLEYLKEQLGYERSHLAILIESNSGLPQAEASNILNDRPGKETRGQDGEESGDLVGEDFIFPLQVSEIRKAYFKRDILRADELDAPNAPERLPIPADEAGTPDDLPRSFTPATSAALDEMALTQILTTIGRRRYQAVGIIASNPFDTVFLARRVRRFCPNLRIFTTQADLLFARPEDVGDLRGMLVASTYSLYPANQWIITSYGARPHVLFSNQGSQGLYNAVVAHLWEMGVGDNHFGPQLLEFSPPYEMAPRAFEPSVWIGAVGERGIFPVRSLAVSKDSDYLYDPKDAPERRQFSPPHDRKKFERESLKAMKTSPHLLYWLFWLVLVSSCFAVAGLTWVYARWATDEHKTGLNAKIGFASFEHLLGYLNYEVAPKGPGEVGPSAAASGAVPDPAGVAPPPGRVTGENSAPGRDPRPALVHRIGLRLAIASPRPPGPSLPGGSTTPRLNSSTTCRRTPARRGSARGSICAWPIS